MVIVVLSFITFGWSFFVFHLPFDLTVVMGVIVVRIVASRFIYSDYNLSWSKASQKTFLLKSFVNIVAFMIYMPFNYTVLTISFFIS